MRVLGEHPESIAGIPDERRRIRPGRHREPLARDRAAVLLPCKSDIARRPAGARRKRARDEERVGILFFDQQQPVRDAAVGFEAESLLDAEVGRLDAQSPRYRCLAKGPRRL